MIMVYGRPRKRELGTKNDATHDAKHGGFPRTRLFALAGCTLVTYTASPAYGEPYLTDFGFGTSTSHEHRTLSTTGLWKIELGLHQGGH